MNSSSVMREAANENVDTLGPENPSESPAGTYQTVTIFDALFHNTPLIASALNFGAKACPTISNIYFGIGVGILNLTGEAILGLFTGGAEPAAEEGAVAAAEGAAEIATDTIISRIVSQFTTRVGLRDTYDFLKKIGVDTVKQGGLIAAASFLAKWTVKDYAASVTGMASGAPLREQLGAGTNALTQTYMQQNMGGAAQTNASLAQSDSADRKYRVDYERSQSFTTRYFALTNPQSLLTHVGMDMASSLNHNIFGRSLASLTQLFRPTVLFSSVMGAISPGAIAADDPATAAGKAHYGNVQFGWTVDEQKTIDSSSSYYPLENDKILDNSGKKDEIISKYGKCFTEPAAQLLEDGDIERTGPYSTDIKPNAGLCSPQQLGPHNPDYGDLVFRYRLSMNYDTTMRIQLGIQNAAGDKDASDE